MISNYFMARAHMLSTDFGHMWENTASGTEFPHIFCDGIGPLQLGVVLVFLMITYLITGFGDHCPQPDRTTVVHLELVRYQQIWW